MGDSFYNDSKNDNVLEDGIVPQEYFARACDYNGDKYDSMNIGTKERKQFLTHHDVILKS